ncbi:MAG TPA: LLM class F420-dependent oxidoreductase [Ilumatobacter sp.]|nr:LLM class F420-dependent oxidoreductase [Ilumatobacter sp.]
MTREQATGLSVVVPLWQDRPAAENVEVGRNADELGFDELWVGEMATYDAFALATTIGLSTNQIRLNIGPLAVAVRTPMTVAMGAASVADLTGRSVGVALGTSSDVVVGEWHGRPRNPAARFLGQHAEATRALLSGHKADVAGDLASTKGYRLRLAPVDGHLTVAAFGPAAVRVAARWADRMLLNMVTAPAAARLSADLAAAARDAGRPTPRLAAWLAVAVDPPDEAIKQMMRGFVAYLAAPGYAEMFEQAGFGELVAFARTRPHPRDLLSAVPSELAESVALVGSVADVRRRIADYRAAGVDDICLVPATASDNGGRRTLEALSER